MCTCIFDDTCYTKRRHGGEPLLMWANNVNKDSPDSDTMLEYSIMIVKLVGGGYSVAYSLYGVFPVPLGQFT